ncbi:hypothetical protein A9404_01840 [Halothiobacillus diazotrophicus]|uniref:Glycerophosphoryl diester phosphodiesterase membrane domain-containing protein n=1 Tax=Halothiobacillus diazotrophicus TaxID=1860122 RepID=A0A191ZEI8_9GAMM|nr:BPSS1780 family membrane protein [Halothiobacillus diazotrophicus]ANJ66284.1 hypothetical protein A9404_01840 [Halothiobacillus diazotrophicus]
MQRLGVGQGASWIAEGWRLLRSRMTLVIGVVILTYVLLFLASMLPFVGNVVVALASPFLMGGIYVVLHRLREINRRAEAEPLAREQPISWDLLFSVFQNPAPRKSLIGYALVSLGFQLLVLLILAGFVAVALSGIDHTVLTDPTATDKQRIEQLWPILTSPSAGILWVTVLVMSVLYGMAVFFVVPLIVLRGAKLWPAMRASFAAVTVNWLPFLVYALIWVLLILTVPFTLGLSLILIGPLMITSVYASFEDIWPEAASSDDETSGSDKPPFEPQEHTSTVM